MVNTSAFGAENRGSIPLFLTKIKFKEMETIQLLAFLCWTVVVKVCLFPLQLVNFVIDLGISVLQITRNTLAFLVQEIEREALKTEDHGRKTNEKQKA